MWLEIKNTCERLTESFDQIPAERKLLLQKLASYIAAKKNQPVKLVFVCTHNSRRSHFGQVWAQVAADYYGLNNIQSYSAGTVATAFFVNAQQALQTLGFKITALDSTNNPHYELKYSDTQTPLICFSKTIQHPANPDKDFAAVMTCSEAETNCPFVPGADFRISTTYSDPKEFDGTAQQAQMYLERCKQIGTELLYTFSLVK